jgi:ribosomal protein L37E
MQAATTIQCARCMGTHVYAMQTMTQSGNPNWEVTACLDCGWPSKDKRKNPPPPGQVKQAVTPIKALEDTGTKLKEFPK